MLEKVPRARGSALRNVRTGAEDLVIVDTALTGIDASIELTSSAFGYNEPIPAKYTVDGDGISPPLAWSNVPIGAAGVVLLIEDADSPTPAPLVHTIAWDLPGVDTSIPEGALAKLSKDAASVGMGRNSYFEATYLPPDPPPGHGPHRYVFQVYAVDAVLRFKTPPGRSELLDKLRGHVMAKGLLIGTYERSGERVEV